MKLRLKHIIYVVLMFNLLGCVTTDENPYKAKAPKKDVTTSYVELGLGYIKKRDYEGAKRPLKRALELDPNSPDVHDALALMFQMQGENKLAEQHFKTALNYAADSARINNNYGSFLYQEKRYEQAYHVLEKATQDPLYANRSQVFENLGMCAVQMGKMNVALDQFERAIKLNPNQLNSVVALANVHNQLGKPKIANDYFEFYMKTLKVNRLRPSASDLLTGVEIANNLQQADKVKAYGVVLQKMYPDSDEYKKYQTTYQ